MDKEIYVDDIKISNKDQLILMAGPCVIESEGLIMKTAEKIKEITARLNIPYIFKASFDKANRTSIDGYRGLGMKKGLKILKKVKQELDIPVITDIHLPKQANIVAEVADILQIPAFLCRQTDLLVAAGKTNKVVNIKKGQFLAPWDMKNVVKKVIKTGNHQVLLCERGTSFGYNNLVVDMTGMIEMKKSGYPVIFDATHSVQKPGGKGSETGGNRTYVKDLAKAGIALGIAGLFMEVHPDPDHALSDGPNMVFLDDLENILKSVKEIDDCVKREFF
ncbi:MAG: 3-deoxy-8-phosphooctulonate synthase [Marinisporobacter sp.]|jgi:2-dehydro-3-deoxyphosphooctonate aldolase (KDO 8-P synthase)|nr:3-deoxy-8-phosphooctulonate synthase [Marinisporobacter sp.]